MHVALYVFAVSLAACVELFQKGGKKKQNTKKQQKSSVSLLAEVCSSRAAVLVYDPEGL